MVIKVLFRNIYNILILYYLYSPAVYELNFLISHFSFSIIGGKVYIYFL